MKLVSPEDWYKLFWVLMGVGFLAAQYFVIKWAILAALMEYELRKRGMI